MQVKTHKRASPSSKRLDAEEVDDKDAAGHATGSVCVCMCVCAGGGGCERQNVIAKYQLTGAESQWGPRERTFSQ